MVQNVKHNPPKGTEDGIAGGAFGIVMLTNCVTKVNAIPLPGDGVTLKHANLNTIGDEYTVINDSGLVGPGGPVTVYPVMANTINGVAAPFLLGAIAPAAGATITLKCIGIGQWWITAIA